MEQSDSASSFFDALFGESSLMTIASLVIIVGTALYLKSQNDSKKSPAKVISNNSTSSSLTSPKDKKQTKASQQPRDSSLTPIKIFFGSQTGTAEEFSRKLASEAKRYKFDPIVTDLEEYDFEELATEKFVMFVVATYGEGEPTDNAREFMQQLIDPSHPSDLLSAVQFTVFGLGNKTYEHYNAVARQVDTRLEELGAQRIFKRGEGDDDASLEDDFAAWKKELWPALCTHFGLEAPVEAANVLDERRWKIEYYSADSSQVANAKQTTPRHLACKKGTGTGTDLNNPYLAKILVNRELHSAQSDRSCRHIEIELIPSIKYEPGDHLGVFPENHPSVVEAAAQRLGVDLDSYFTLFNTKDSKIVIGPCTVRQALTQWCDLTNPPRKGVIKVLAALATSPEEKQRLELLSDDEKHEPYGKYIKEDMRNVIELLEEFPSVKIPFDHFVEIVPRLAPRYYSISSSLKENPNRVHITSVVVEFIKPTKRRHIGVCTNWLLKQIPSEGHFPQVPIYVRRSTFHLPKQLKVPLVMIGPGTGLAPFRGFIQERSFLEKVEGVKSENLLFFGCRHPNIDFIYKDELLAMHNDGLIQLYAAFSRETANKVYVQHKMSEAKKAIWEALSDKGGFFYICGDARQMAKDVHQTLQQIIMECGGKTSEEAEKFIENLQKTNRYLTDVWF